MESNEQRKERLRVEMVNSYLFDESDGGIDVVFSFDTTGSMYGVLRHVREKISQTATKLLQDIPNIRIAIIAHGDYYDDRDKHAPLLSILDFSRNTKTIVDFVNQVPPTCGADWPEAYEYVLRECQTRLTWAPNSKRALVMIGDATPHPPSYTSEQIYWRDELHRLYRFMNVKIYAVQAWPNAESTPFWEEMARRTGGVYLTLNDFAMISQMFHAVCYREQSPEALQRYREDIAKEKNGQLDDNLRKMFNKLEMEINPAPLGQYEFEWWNLQTDNGYLAYELQNGRFVLTTQLNKRNRLTKSLFERNPTEKEAEIPTVSTRVGSSIMDAPSKESIKRFNERKAAAEASGKPIASVKPKDVYTLQEVKPGIWEMVLASKVVPKTTTKKADGDVDEKEKSTSTDESSTETPTIVDESKFVEKPQPGAPAPKTQSELDSEMVLSSEERRKYATERLMRDLKEIQQNPLHNVIALPLEDNLFEWHGNLSGPQGSVYDGVVFHFRIVFTENYPVAPPSVSLFTQLFHPNVFGKWLCLDMLELGAWGSDKEKGKLFTGWSTAYTVHSILCQLQAFLFEGVFEEEQFVRESTTRSKLFHCRACGHQCDGNGVYPPLPQVPLPSPPKSEEGSAPAVATTKKKKAAGAPASSHNNNVVKPAAAVVPVAAAAPAAVETPVNNPRNLNQVQVGMKITGKVTSIQESGVIVKFDDSSLTGFAHVTHISDVYFRNIRDIIKLDAAVQGHVIDFDPARRRISLSLLKNPLNRIWKVQRKLNIEQLEVGMERVGEIVEIIDIGMIVQLGVFDNNTAVGSPARRINGFLHISELEELSSVGDLIKVWILKIDMEKKRIKLSARDPKERNSLIERLTRAIVFDDENSTKNRKKKEEVDYERLYSSLTGSPFEFLSMELLFAIMDCLNPVDLYNLGLTCKLLNRVCSDGLSYLWQRHELVCFHSKRSFQDDVLGVGLNLESKMNGKLAYITTTFDLLSYTSFMHEKVRKASYKEPFTHWIPLYINQHHGKRALPILKEAMAKICTDCYGEFKPEHVLDVIPKLMNTFVVSAMSGKLYASIMALEGYCAFHHLLLMFMEEFPELKIKVNDIISSFCENDKQRHKKRIAALGEWLPLLTVTEQFTWKDVAVPYLLEMFDRNVLWTLKKFPQYREVSKPDLFSHRLANTFDATRVSNHLLMFHVYFLKHIARPEGVTLAQTKEMLDLRYGRPTEAMKENLLRECKRIQNVDTWDQFFKKIYLAPPSEGALIQWLHESLRNSARKKYHNPLDFSPEVLARRAAEEQKVEETPLATLNTKKSIKKRRATVRHDDLTDTSYIDG